MLFMNEFEAADAATPPERCEYATSHAATGAAGSDSGSEVPDILRVDREAEKHQPKRLDSFKEDRAGRQMQRRLEEIREASRGGKNPLPVLRQALKDRRLTGELCGVMPDVFGEYTPTF
jgi:methylmalonyl-CoA mutase N-terminal domain/subunit